MRKILFIAFLGAWSASAAVGQSAGRSSRKDYPIQPVPFTQVHLADTFWAPRLETNRTITIPFTFKKCEETGRINNFEIAAGKTKGSFCTKYPFDDSDVFKIIEGASYVLALQPDPKLDRYLDELIDLIAAAQEKDGYLYTARTIDPARPPEMAGKERFSNEYMSHELYNAGHLYEAAAAYFLATGKRSLLNVARKNADFLLREFGPGKRLDAPGHQVIEIGLSKLYRLTGNDRYLHLAKFFLDERGNAKGHKLYGEYSQDHIPVLQQSEAVGHAVRAAYMYAGMADVAALTGNMSYIQAIDRLWENVVGKKLYLTGGIGSTGAWEGFGPDYELPNASAYAETCAAIANAMWNHRMFLLHGDGKYIDVLERILYNGMLSGYSLSGDRFFYANPLTSFGQHERSPWFSCACCPSNITRYIPSIPGYAYATIDDLASLAGDSRGIEAIDRLWHAGIYVNLYIAGRAEIDFSGGRVVLEQKTSYPWQGDITLTVTPESARHFAIMLRIPGWALGRPLPGNLYHYLEAGGEKPRLQVNGADMPLAIDRGYAVIARKWSKGDSIELTLPMPIRRVLANDAVKDDRGRVAVERGPIVYCAEWSDNGGRVLNLILEDGAPLQTSLRTDLFGGIMTISGTGKALRLDNGRKFTEKKEITLLPYYAWAHRGKGEMSVWLARTQEAARPAPMPSIASTSQMTASGGSGLLGINDQYEPESSNDHSTPYFHWWPKKGSQEWVQYQMKEKTTVNESAVYWFDDTGEGECRMPKSWRLLYHSGNEWLPVLNLNPYEVERNRYDIVRFSPVATDALRLEVQLPDHFSSGIQEWKVSAAPQVFESGEIPGIRNPSFENLEGDNPVAWKAIDRDKAASFQVDRISHSGGTSVRISSEKGADAFWQTAARVLPYSRYRLSGWIRTENVRSNGGKGALLNLHNLQPLQTEAITGTRNWTKVFLVFDTRDNDAVLINCLLGGWGRATGTAWFDDIHLELLSSQKLQPKAIIETARLKAPVSKYIYGQFIEHLGRCIYQGIWAEMLEDRKFYYPAGSAESPWKIIGPAANISMNPILHFSGLHAPQVRLKGTGEPGGIFQENLTVLPGREYTGRIVLAGEAGAAPVKVSLAWGERPEERQTIDIVDINDTYRTYPLRFKTPTANASSRLEITSSGCDSFRIGAVSLMPADNVSGFRPDVLALLKELNAPVYRWPGGNFVSGYNWKDGTGDRDRRPPRKNPAWSGIEPNDVGIHEFMEFCRLVGAEPYITVNSGQGNEVMAAEEVEYVNGTAETPMGRLRAQNGHTDPFGCRFWSIGNEMYGDWQLGYMPVDDYTRKHNRFALAMKAVDKTIQIVAVGETGTWDERMLARCSENMDLISEHFYCSLGPGLLSHSAQVPRQVRRIADAHRRYRQNIPALKGKEIRIALDEWNYWYGPYVYGELGTQYFLKDALGIARGIHETIRNSDIYFMANYAQTVNVIGAVKTSKTDAVFDATGLVLKLYRKHFGSIPVKISGHPEPLDVSAAWREDRRALTVAVVNPGDKSLPFTLQINGVPVPANARLWRISGTDPFLCNVPGSPPRLVILETASTPLHGKLEIPPLSISIFEIAAGES